MPLFSYSMNLNYEPFLAFFLSELSALMIFNGLEVDMLRCEPGVDPVSRTLVRSGSCAHQHLSIGDSVPVNRLQRWRINRRGEN